MCGTTQNKQNCQSKRGKTINFTSKMFRDTDDIECIQARLLQLQIDKDVIVARKLLKQVLHAAVCDVDTLPVFPAVAKLLASNDLIVKKLASWYLSQHGSHPDFVLLVINTLLKDCRDPNPMIRGLAIKTLSNIPLPSMVDYCTQPVTESLKDPSAYVRRTAVIACGKIHTLNPNVAIENGWIDTLYAMIRDNDPIVVANCISVLEKVLHEEGGMVVNRQIAHHLLNKMSSFTDWHLVVALRVLKKYRPRNDDETLDIMNIADAYLKSNNSSVSLETLEFFLCLIKKMPHLETELYKRATAQIHHFLGSDNPELVFVLLEVIGRLIDKKADFTSYHKFFFCKYNEPAYIKEKKISMLPLLVTAENVKGVLDELNMYSLDVVSSVARESVRAITKIAHSMPEFTKTCIERLLLLLESHPQDVTDELLEMLQDLDFRHCQDLDKALQVVTSAEDWVETDSGHAALISIIGDYGEHIEDGPYYLENYVQRLEEEDSTVISLSLLTAATKMFLKRPAECQEFLGRLMEMCMESKTLAVRDRVYFYYQLLKTDPNEAKKVFHIDTLCKSVSNGVHHLS